MSCSLKIRLKNYIRKINFKENDLDNFSYTKQKRILKKQRNEKKFKKNKKTINNYLGIFDKRNLMTFLLRYFNEKNNTFIKLRYCEKYKKDLSNIFVAGDLDYIILSELLEKFKYDVRQEMLKLKQ